MTNYYEILGVDSSASSRDLYAAYKKKALAVHPDKPGGNTEVFQQTLIAFETLSDPWHRANYDYRLFGSASHAAAAKASRAKQEREANSADLKRAGQEMCEVAKTASGEVASLREDVRGLASDLQELLRSSKGKNLRTLLAQAKEKIRQNQEGPDELAAEENNNGDETEDFEEEESDDVEDEWDVACGAARAAAVSLDACSSSTPSARSECDDSSAGSEVTPIQGH